VSEEDYQHRLVDQLLDELLAELPALLVVGPRAAGKTTTASRHAATVIHLDEPAQAAAFRADPDAALRGLDEPVLLDEWQAVPEVLGAVKRAVDRDSHPGRYLVTGSVRAELDNVAGDRAAGAGAAVRNGGARTARTAHGRTVPGPGGGR
jgi:predicted AAA+ superfamily ATPase